MATISSKQSVLVVLGKEIPCLTSCVDMQAKSVSVEVPVDDIEHHIIGTADLIGLPVLLRAYIGSDIAEISFVIDNACYNLRKNSLVVVTIEGSCITSEQYDKGSELPSSTKGVLKIGESVVAEVTQWETKFSPGAPAAPFNPLTMVAGIMKIPKAKTVKPEPEKKKPPIPIFRGTRKFRDE